MKPRCPRCAHAVTVVREAGGNFAAWCACSMVSSRDDSYRAPGRGMTADEALQQWRDNSPSNSRTPESNSNEESKP